MLIKQPGLPEEPSILIPVNSSDYFQEGENLGPWKGRAEPGLVQRLWAGLQENARKSSLVWGFWGEAQASFLKDL